jgi:hypothetical protein
MLMMSIGLTLIHGEVFFQSGCESDDDYLGVLIGCFDVLPRVTH